MDYKNEYNELMELIGNLRDSLLSSVVDDSSAYYPSFMSNPEEVIEWTTNYFSKMKITPLTTTDILDFIVPNLDKFEYVPENNDFKTYNNGACSLGKLISKETNEVIEDDLFINWDYVVKTMETSPELFTDSVLINKIYKVLKK